MGEMPTNMPINITTLCENTASRVGLLAEWGLSILIETGEDTVLFDTGQGTVAIHNAASMGLDVPSIDRIVLSHGHRDHTGGLLSVLNAIRRDPAVFDENRALEVIAHPDIWTPRYSRATFGKEVYAGIVFVRDALENLGASFTLAREPVWITENMVTTGEIPMQTDYEKVDADLYVKDDRAVHPDPVADDLALAIITDVGLVVILGCAHRGIVNTLRRVQEVTDTKRIHMVIGGIHLFRAPQEQIESTIAELKGYDVKKIGVSHCTGLHAAVRLSQEFGDRFFFNNAGTYINI
jgi:7,8-dihydropterin-6-yl-methyl-4-(beta-D-ribofuranosyl)aminobenzene 5'-phosphate synthase